VKIFGFDIQRAKKEQPVEQIVVQDEVPDIKAVIPDTKKPALLPRIKDPTLDYNDTRYLGRGAFQSAEYDLAEIGKIEDTDSYVRQAFDKKVALMLKEGYDFTGPNLRTIKYIKARFAQIAAASKISTNQLVRDIGSALVRKSNCFLIKARDVKSSGGAIRKENGKGGKTLKPVAGYFVAAAETMEYELTSGYISAWRQMMPNGSEQTYDVSDVIHIAYDRKEGFVFGTPVLTPVIDDIRALRKIEENIELLVYQHLFPLFQYIVGTPEAPAGYTEDGQREIDVVRREIQYMPSEGGIVTPERHKIEAIGAEGRALRAEGYLEHFKKRVFAGLGVSAVDMGEGETANRATADNMSRNMVDSVKDLQQVVSDAINEFIIKELLLESTFGPDVLDEENMVRLVFREIDTEAKIKKQSHAADLFAKDIITHDEARKELGLEPLRLPSFEDVQNGTDGAEQYPEWNRMRWKLFAEPQLLISASDEPFSPASIAAAKNPATAVAPEDIDEAGDKQNEQEMELEKEKTKAKIAVAKAKPRPVVRNMTDGYLSNTFNQVKEDTVSRITQREQIDQDWIATLIRTQMSTTIQRLIGDQMIAFRSELAKYVSPSSEDFMMKSSRARSMFSDRAEYYINRLTNAVITTLRRRLTDSMSLDEIAREVRAIFDSMSYRTDFIEDVEIRKAMMYGKAIGIKGKKNAYLISKTDEKSKCTICRDASQTAVDMSVMTLDDVAPHHANCACDISVISLGDSGSDLEENQDGVKLESCVLQVKKSLRQKHPDWSEDRIKSSAFAICNASLKKG
jgi:hypothetical protein